MLPEILSIRNSLNKAYLKVKPIRSGIELFKSNISELITHSNSTESEEHHKNIIATFLKKTYYDPDHYINTKGRTDLVIHVGKDSKSPVGVIIETKRPGSKSEMPSKANLNAKAVHELILYYLRERITDKNLEIKHLIATDLNEWFIFNSQEFERLFATNKKLVKDFEQFEAGTLSGSKTDFFYNEIAKPFIESLDKPIQFTHFNTADYKEIINNSDKKDDNKLIGLYKIFSPEHLLKMPFSNDSNTLDRKFYNELLHIIGLEETKDGGKKIIGRKAEKTRNADSLLENTINILKYEDSLNQLTKRSDYGVNTEEQLFTVALELVITWLNRILFLKLLEGQLIRYHQKDEKYKFLHSGLIPGYDALNKLFFHVLAVKEADRNEKIKQVFGHVPYLNSSLFEPSELEQKTIRISNLDDNSTIPILSSTVLKDISGNKVKGEERTLNYLLRFLDSYDFSSEGKEDISEENKTLINASVLGLIFEKINGYKDGSFFTPGFITMYMCRETIRRAVIQKFNELRAPLSRGAGGVSFSELPSTANTPLLREPVPLQREAGGVSRRTIIPYNPNLKALARDLRNNSTRSEIALWLQLKGKFEGKYDFHRQKPLDNYIADFFCHELKLVIEIDGITHDWEETQKKDYIKECRLNELGLNVLRFTDDEVLNNLDRPVNLILLYIEGFEKADLSSFKYEDTPLNPLSRGDFALPDVNILLPSKTQHQPLSKTHPLPLSKTHPLPLSKTHPLPLSRGEYSRIADGSGGNEFSTLEDVYNCIGEGGLCSKAEANSLINSLKICDPAVGSGHFLVSALNEIIAIKSELKILTDRKGKILRDYTVEVINDELVITDEDGEFFEYHPKNPESQRIQETLFHEKQTIIENCLFGVDINQNSVKICRLRLWIELLKNAYYKPEPPSAVNNPLLRGARGVSFPETSSTVNTPLSRGAGGVSLSRGAGGVSSGILETLPNIDINIKCGNSLISRYPLDADIKKALQKSRWSIDSYRAAIMTYRNAENKDQKAEMRHLIDQIKSDFESEVALNDKRYLKLNKLKGELTSLTSQTSLFSLPPKEKAEWRKKVSKVTSELNALEKELEEIKSNKIYEHAFEWRFEFPEVLNDEGDFVGFDVVIGNPPYGTDFSDPEKTFIKENYKSYQYKYDSYIYFIELALNISSIQGYVELITPILWLSLDNCYPLRILLIKDNDLKRVFIHGEDVFDEAIVNTCSFQVQHSVPQDQLIIIYNNENILISKSKYTDESLLKIDYRLNQEKKKIIDKVKENSVYLLTFGEVIQGITPYDSYRGHSVELIKKRAFHFNIKKDETCGKWLEGKNLHKFSVKWESTWLSYGDWLAAPREKKYFEGKRILFREVPGKDKRIQACIIEEEFYYGHSISPFKPKIIYLDSLEYILGIVNSQLLSWYARFTLSNFGKDIFPKLNPNDIKELPIPKEFKHFNEISDLVARILKKKNIAPTINTTDLEKQIDKLVYKIYALTEEEIKIVEEAVS